MKLPCKDPVTIPWMSQREIPAIKAVLSAWRKLREDDEGSVEINRRFAASLVSEASAAARAEMTAHTVADMLEELAAIDERPRKEAKNAKAKA